MSQNRRQEAQTIIEKFYGPVDVAKDDLTLKAYGTNEEEYEQKSEVNISNENIDFREKWKNVIELFSHVELRKRIVIVYFAWAATSLSYYAIGEMISLSHRGYIKKNFN